MQNYFKILTNMRIVLIFIIVALAVVVAPTARMVELENLGDGFFINPVQKKLAFSQPQPELNDPSLLYGTVYFAFTVDTEPEGLDIAVYSDEPDLRAYEQGGLIEQLMDPELRNQYRDSFGDPLVFSWFLLTQQVECASTLQDCSFIHAVMEPYREQAYALGDMYGWHYHHMDWTDTNLDGIHFWNQLRTFNGTTYGSGTDIQVAERIVAQLIFDKGVYPSAFRTGWTWENTQFSNWLDDITPFDFSNISPLESSVDDGGPPDKSIPEPIFNIFDWSRALRNWTYYHPSSHDYQKSGDLKRFIFRSYNSAPEWEKAFKEAMGGNNQLVTVYAHSYNEITLYEDMLNHLSTLRAKYPDVKLKFVTASEGARRMTSPVVHDTASPVATVFQPDVSPSEYFVTVSVDEPLFTFPYGALFVNGDYSRVRPTQEEPVVTADGQYQWTFDLGAYLDEQTDAQFRIGGIDPSDNWFTTPVVAFN